MEFDHIFICVQPGAREAEVLKEFGFAEGSENTHPGQGTANRRFFFRNSVIELLYLHNSAEARSERTNRTNLYERLTSTNNEASPFGICFRPTSPTEQVPFPSWRYTPIYLPKDWCIYIGNAPISEPMWFFSPFGLRPEQLPVQRQQPLEHPNGLRNITSIRITTPHADTLSSPAVAANGIISFEFAAAREHLAVIGFDEESKGRRHDFRPQLPLVVSW